MNCETDIEPFPLFPKQNVQIMFSLVGQNSIKVSGKSTAYYTYSQAPIKHLHTVPTKSSEQKLLINFKLNIPLKCQHTYEYSTLPHNLIIA